MQTQTTEQHDYPRGLTFEKVWAMFQETDRKFQETREQMKETDRQIKETDRQMKETREQMKETDRLIGKLGNRFGELAEHLVSPGIMNKFNELGFSFTEQSMDLKIKDSGNPNACAEIDILLENGDIVIAIEVKAKPKQGDILDHIERMEVLRQRAARRNDTRKYQGAIAGAIMDESVRKFILKTGFYVIEQTGDNVRINIPEDFIPREW
jgi:hypothetical protein